VLIICKEVLQLRFVSQHIRISRISVPGYFGKSAIKYCSKIMVKHSCLCICRSLHCQCVLCIMSLSEHILSCHTWCYGVDMDIFWFEEQLEKKLDSWVAGSKKVSLLSTVGRERLAEVVKLTLYGGCNILHHCAQIIVWSFYHYTILG
jgi:hypothetical protein